MDLWKMFVGHVQLSNAITVMFEMIQAELDLNSSELICPRCLFRPEAQMKSFGWRQKD